MFDPNAIEGDYATYVYRSRGPRFKVHNGLRALLTCLRYHFYSHNEIDEVYEYCENLKQWDKEAAAYKKDHSTGKWVPLKLKPIVKKGECFWEDSPC